MCIICILTFQLISNIFTTKSLCKTQTETKNLQIYTNGVGIAVY